MAKGQPIIVIKKVSGHGGHHGGAWKVAYADFVTAMMALFIVLWLMGSSSKVKKAVAGYFNDPKGTASQLGTTMTGTGDTVQPFSTKDLEKLKEKLEAEIKSRKDLEKLSKQIEITITPEGLRIELIEDKAGTFYDSGSARLSASGQELLALLASELKTLPNNLLIEGHTDATPYSSDTNYGNWELSADRANSARRLMQQDGVRNDQVTQVRGYADQFLRVKNNPTDPSNRRVSILVKNDDGSVPTYGSDAILSGKTKIDADGSVAGAAKPGTGAKPAEGGKPATETKPAENAKAAEAPKPASGENKPTPTPPPAQQQAKPAAPAAPAAKPGLMDKVKGLFGGKK